MKKIAVLIDGGFLRVQAKKAKKMYTASLVEKVALSAKSADEEIYRILYYDCEEYKGSQKLPISGQQRQFEPTSTLLHDLCKKDLFAIRKGVLKFRGFKPLKTTLGKANITDADFRPDFEQKGVDMRIGLDIALFCQTRAIERVVMMTNDTDTIPAMKYARRSGLQIVLVQLQGSAIAKDLPAHADYIRPLVWP